MKVKDLMTTSVISVSPDATVNEVAEVLHQHHFTGVPVVEADNTLVGLIAERDFIASDSKLYLPTYIKMLTEIDYIKGDNKHLPQAVQQVIDARARDIMNRNVVTVSEDTELQNLAEIFATKRVNPIPVTDLQGKLAGVISRSDLIKLFSRQNL